jgi:SAM-dependent methyltransferase
LNTASARPCPLCDADNAAAAPAPCSSGPWRLKACGRCGFVYLENPPAPAALNEDYAWEKTYAAEKARRRSEEPVLDWFSRMVKQLRRRVFKRDKLTPLMRRHVGSGPVLDVGCGAGAALRRLGELGFVPFGLEISEHLAGLAAGHARAHGGDVIAGGALEGLDRFPDGQFRGAIMISYLEHETRPQPVLAKLRRKLAAGGALILKVPNFASWNRAVRGARWCGFRFPDHVNYFTPRTLWRLVTQAGFLPVRFSLRDHFPSSDNMWMVCRPA